MKDVQLNKDGTFFLIKEYSKSFLLLNQFDCDRIPVPELCYNRLYELDYEESLSAIQQLKSYLVSFDEANELFGRERQGGFKAILENLQQTYNEELLYPTIEEQAANLMYGIIKNHPFSDGNKRIGALMFVYFLNRNGYLHKPNGSDKINDNALTLLAILIAQSNPNDKDLIIELVVNLISNS